MTPSEATWPSFLSLGHKFSLTLAVQLFERRDSRILISLLSLWNEANLKERKNICLQILIRVHYLMIYRDIQAEMVLLCKFIGKRPMEMETRFGTPLRDGDRPRSPSQGLCRGPHHVLESGTRSTNNPPSFFFWNQRVLTWTDLFVSFQNKIESNHSHW